MSVFRKKLYSCYLLNLDFYNGRYLIIDKKNIKLKKELYFESYEFSNFLEFFYNFF